MSFLSVVKILETDMEILKILKHCFEHHLKAAHRIRKMEGNETIPDYNTPNSFKQLKAITSLKIKSRRGRTLTINFDGFKRKVEENLTSNTRKLSEELGSLKDTGRTLGKLQNIWDILRGFL